MQQNGKLRSTAKIETNETASRKEFLLSALDRFEQPLTAYATRLFCGNEDCARDVVQHTFMQLCKQPPGRVAHKLAPWLYTVCRNRVLDELKSNKRQATTISNEFEQADPKAHDPADRAEQIDFLKCVRELMSQLRDSERDVIELWSHGFNAKEISQILSRPEGTVRVNLHRGIKALRRHTSVANWLERATGQIVRPDAEHVNSSSASNCSNPPATSITSERT